MLQSSKARLLHESLRRYLRGQAWDHLDKVLRKTRDEELAIVLSSMSEEQQIELFRRLPSAERKANVIVQMEPPFGKRVLDPLPPDKAAAILKEMAADDVTDIVADLEPEHARAVLQILEGGDAVEELMQYGDETAGGIMLPDFIALRAENTAEEALMTLRESGDVEMIYYIYVIDDAGHLVGVLSLRKLVAAPPTTRVRDIADSDVISVKVDTDQEVVAQLVARYGFLAVPVVDDTNKLIGIVTVDDVIDVLREEATEDMLKMAGAGTAASETVAGNLKARFPWLFVASLGGLLGAGVMSRFQETLQAHYYLALFLPIVLGMSGNVGTQSATVTVRALAIGQITHMSKGWAVIRRELGTALVLGLLYGAMVGVAAWGFSMNVGLGITVGTSLATGFLVANLVGTTIPLVLHRFSVDPAVATGPFVTTSMDILGVATYFTIATLLGDYLPG